MEVTAHCAHHPSLKVKDLAERCRVTAVPSTFGDNHKRRIVHAAAPDLPGVTVPSVTTTANITNSFPSTIEFVVLCLGRRSQE